MTGAPAGGKDPGRATGTRAAGVEAGQDAEPGADVTIPGLHPESAPAYTRIESPCATSRTPNVSAFRNSREEPAVPQTIANDRWALIRTESAPNARMSPS